MPFTAQELSNISNAVLDYHLRGKPESQIKQARPLFDDLTSMKKSFPGGKDYITGPVKGTYTTTMTGYSHDDEQGYANPANIKRWQYPWYELGGGIQVTYTELKKAGISVLESDGSRTGNHSEKELIELTNILEDKLEDLDEGSKRSFAEICWRDGTQDAKVFPGILGLILTAPTTGTTGGIDRATNSWWRNRASLSLNVSTPSNLVLTTKLQNEFRQLRRYASPKHKFYAGSDFMDAFEQELRSKGNFTLEGWAKSGRIDASVADLAFKGVALQYDPLLDDLGYSKYGFVLDLNAIRLMPMEGEEWKMHTPERPPEKYVLYRALTWTGALTTNRLNTSGVYSIA